MQLYVLPKMGTSRIGGTTTGDVMGFPLADDLWNQKRVTARRERQKSGAVMKWATAQGFREDNPAWDAISAALPKNGSRVRLYRALSHSDVGAALAASRWPTLSNA